VRAKLGIALTASGVLVLVWLAVTLYWGEPFTALYTRYEQGGLAHRLATVNAQWNAKAPSPAGGSIGGTKVSYAQQAKAFAKDLHDGSPLGEIEIPAIGLHMVVVQGTTTGDLERGPGHYDAQSGQATDLPGMGGVVGIAGHRTTFLEPFRHIDALRLGDRIEMTMPYGTFTYEVIGHQTVLPSDWAILQPRSFEEIVLSACTPVYSASHRLVVYARLVGVRAPSSSAATG
jgi:sortase A